MHFRSRAMAFNYIGASVDPRLHQITVRQLLEHSGGFDSTRFDPQLHALRLASFGHPPPATHTDIIRYMMGKPLAFDPGTKYVYSLGGHPKCTTGGRLKMYQGSVAT